MSSPYIGDGCEVSPSCLDCPLPQCKYDDPVTYRTTRMAEQVQQRVSTYQAAGSAAKAAKWLGVNPKTIQRAMKRARQG